MVELDEGRPSSEKYCDNSSHKFIFWGPAWPQITVGS